VGAIDTALSGKNIPGALGKGAVLGVCLGIGLLGWSTSSGGRSAAAVPSVRTARRGRAGRAGADRVADQHRTAGADDRHRHRAAQLRRGLAIGNSAATGQLALAVLLIIGFGLHNATEGFGIVAPLAGNRPSWGIWRCSVDRRRPDVPGHHRRQSWSTTCCPSHSWAWPPDRSSTCDRTAGRGAQDGHEGDHHLGVLLGLMLGFITDAIVTAAEPDSPVDLALVSVATAAQCGDSQWVLAVFGQLAP